MKTSFGKAEPLLPALKPRRFRYPGRKPLDNRKALKGGVNFWHQDSLYWPIVTPKNTQVTAWVALDDVDEENGCMWMVPGTHLWGDHIDFLHSLRPTGFRSMPKEYQNRDVQVKSCPAPRATFTTTTR